MNKTKDLNEAKVLSGLRKWVTTRDLLTALEMPKAAYSKLRGILNVLASQKKVEVRVRQEGKLGRPSFEYRRQSGG